MTAITMGMGQYALSIEDAWLRNGISRQEMPEDGPLIFRNARQAEGVYNQSDRLLIAITDRRKEDIFYADFKLEHSKSWHDNFSKEEREVIRRIGRKDLARTRMSQEGRLHVEAEVCFE